MTTMNYDEGSNNNSREEEEDDPVVKEIPLIVSKRLADRLYVFQYPLRPSCRNNSLDVKRCSIKTENQEVKLEVELNTSSANFDLGKAEYTAQKIDSNRSKNEEPFFENELLDKVQYLSKKNVKDPKNYAVGIYNGSEYHITPLKGILELQPYYPHLDRNIKRKRDQKEEEEEEEEEPKPGTSTSNAQLVSVKFARNENPQWKSNQEKSYRKLVEKSSDEPWIECDWHSERSELSELEKVKLYAEETKSTWTPTSEQDDPIEYIRSLVPEDQEQKIVKPSLPSNVLSFNSLRALPLLDQCKILLKDAKIIQYQQLVMLLAGCEGVTSDLILKTLPQVSVLVRGNWVVKSEILFPSKTLSAISGVPAEVMCRARDYILILFTKNQYVERRKVSSVLRIPAEELKDIFVGISKLRYNRGWDLLLPTDIDFIAKHQEVVARQTALWEQRSAQLDQFFKETGTKEKRQRRKSKSVSEEVARSTSESDTGGEKVKTTPHKGKGKKIEIKREKN